MKPWMIGLLLAGAAAGCGAQDNASTAPTTDEPAGITAAPDELEPKAADGRQQAQPVSVKILNYNELQQLIAGHKGKVVVMDAWSTSCEPCIKEFPNLVALHKKYGPDKLACISLSFDYEGIGKPEDVVPMVRQFLEKQGATFDNVVSSEESEALYQKMQLASIPAVYVYNQQGELAKRFDNEEIENESDAFNYEHVGKLVAELLGAAK